MAMFNGANGPLNGGGPGCGAIVSVVVAAKLIGELAVAGAARVKVRRSAVDVVSASRNTLGDCTPEALLFGFSCGIEDVGASDNALRDDFLGASSRSASGADAAGAVTGGWPLTALGASSLSLDALALTVAGDGSAVFDGVELVCAPPVVCATAVPGSGVVDEPAEDEVEEGLDGLSLSVDEEADELDVSELDEVESEGSASATPGIVATADPTPSATANAPTRPTYLT